MASAAALRMLVRMYREGHPDATPDTLASRLEDAAQMIEYLRELITLWRLLTPEEWERFCAALDNPPKPTDALIRLMRE